MNVSFPSYYKRILLILPILLWLGNDLCAQVERPVPVIDSNELALKYMKEQRKKWGPNDTVIVPAIFIRMK
ncbi:MAG: hypothetical protein IPI68_11370 [Chitinophagaceae bacterium]|nr:hypothetical protein [Chitinophagaceae bacterium]